MNGITPASTDHRLAVAEALADGQTRSGQDIANALGLSRSAVWKHVRSLADLGVVLEAEAGRGYRLARPLELLDARRIRTGAGTLLDRLELHASLDSTNSHLLAQPAPPPGRLHACLAEHQSAGRGRRGRSWAAPFGGGLYLSLAWQFAERPPQFTALGLAVGVAVRRALAEIGVDDVQLKWPNDIVHAAGKLGGVLVELRGEADGPALVVIGIGINIALPPAVRAAIVPGWGRGPVDLAQTGVTGCRNRLAGALIVHAGEMLEDFQRQGFAPFIAEFHDADFLLRRPVHAPLPTGEVDGIADGVEPDGSLRVVVGERVHLVSSGEVSVKVAR